MAEKESKKQLTKFIVPIAAALIFAALGFIGGMKYQQTKVPMFVGQGRNIQFGQGGRNGQFIAGNGNRQTGFRPVAGEIVNIDDKTMTVKMMDGSTKIVILSESATYSKSADGLKSDLATGTQVAVFGTENSDGSVTAQNVQINPAMRINGTPRP